MVQNPADPNSLAGTVFFTPESKVGLPTSGAGKEDPTAFTLTPYPGGREYLFTAQSRVDRIHWVWSLESAIANCKARQASRDTAADGKQTYTSAKQTRLTWEKSKSDPQGVFRWEGKGVQGSLVVQDVSDVILSDVLNSFDPKIAGVDPARLVTILGHTEGRGVQLNLACQSSQEATRLFRALRRLLSLRSDPLLANEAMTRLTVLVSLHPCRGEEEECLVVCGRRACPDSFSIFSRVVCVVDVTFCVSFCRATRPSSGRP